MKKYEFQNKRQEDLFESNKGFAIKLANDWNKKCEIEREELQSYALESLCIAAIKYDDKKCDKFLNYAAVVINTNIRRQIKANNTQKKLAEKSTRGFEDYEYSILGDPDNNIRFKSLLLTVDEILNKFSKSQKEAIMKYLLDKMTLNELAKEYGVSMRTVHKWVIKGREELRASLS